MPPADVSVAAAVETVATVTPPQEQSSVTNTTTTSNSNNIPDLVATNQHCQQKSPASSPPPPPFAAAPPSVAEASVSSIDDAMANPTSAPLKTTATAFNTVTTTTTTAQTEESSSSGSTNNCTRMLQQQQQQQQHQAEELSLSIIPPPTDWTLTADNHHYPQESPKPTAAEAEAPSLSVETAKSSLLPGEVKKEKEEEKEEEEGESTPITAREVRVIVTCCSSGGGGDGSGGRRRRGNNNNRNDDVLPLLPLTAVVTPCDFAMMMLPSVSASLPRQKSLLLSSSRVLENSPPNVSALRTAEPMELFASTAAAALPIAAINGIYNSAPEKNQQQINDSTTDGDNDQPATSRRISVRAQAMLQRRRQAQQLHGREKNEATSNSIMAVAQKRKAPPSNNNEMATRSNSGKRQKTVNLDEYDDLPHENYHESSSFTTTATTSTTAESSAASNTDNNTRRASGRSRQPPRHYTDDAYAHDKLGHGHSTMNDNHDGDDEYGSVMVSEEVQQQEHPSLVDKKERRRRRDWERRQRQRNTSSSSSTLLIQGAQESLSINRSRDANGRFIPLGSAKAVSTSLVALFSPKLNRRNRKRGSSGLGKSVTTTTTTTSTTSITVVSSSRIRNRSASTSTVATAFATNKHQPANNTATSTTTTISSSSPPRHKPNALLTSRLVQDYKQLATRGVVDAIYFGATMTSARAAMETKLANVQHQISEIVGNAVDWIVRQEQKDLKKSLVLFRRFEEQERLERYKEKNYDDKIRLVLLHQTVTSKKRQQDRLVQKLIAEPVYFSQGSSSTRTRSVGIVASACPMGNECIFCSPGPLPSQQQLYSLKRPVSCGSGGGGGKDDDDYAVLLVPKFRKVDLYDLDPNEDEEEDDDDVESDEDNSDGNDGGSGISRKRPRRRDGSGHLQLSRRKQEMLHKLDNTELALFELRHDMDFVEKEYNRNAQHNSIIPPANNDIAATATAPRARSRK